MKISEYNADRLTFTSAPWFYGAATILLVIFSLQAAWTGFAEGDSKQGWGLIAVAVIVGGIAFSLFVRRVDVKFNRPERTVEICERTIFGVNRKSVPLGEVEGAVLETMTRGQGQPTHRVALVTEGGQVPLTRAFYSGNSAEKVVFAINGWVEDTLQ